jgi:hypothetical protein
MISKHEIQILKIKDLVAAEYNPRDWDEESQKGLTASLKEFGMAQLPCVNIRSWDNNKGRIVVRDNVTPNQARGGGLACNYNRGIRPRDPKQLQHDF